MIEEESIQLNKIVQISYLNTKLTKLQLQQMNLQQIIQQCITLIQDGIPFRECTNYLNGLAMVYLRQYQYLKQEIQSLQHSMMNKENFVEVEKNQRSKTKNQTKPRNAVQKDPITELQEYSNNSRDNPRNIASAERLQLESQKTPFDINMYLRKEDSDSSNGFGAANIIMKDVQSIEKQSLSEILQIRKNQREVSQTSSKNTPMLPRIVINDNEGNIEEEQFEFQQDDENESQEDVMETKVETSHTHILKALEDLGLHFDEANQTKQMGKKQTKKQQVHTKQIDVQDKQLNDNYQKNLEEFIRYQDKVDDLQIKLDLMNLQPEFWSKQDDLMHMINQYEIPLNQTVLNQKTFQQNSYSKIQGMTTIENSNNHFQDDNEYEFQEEISEFPNQSPNKPNQIEQKVYEKLLNDLKTEFRREKVIESVNYFYYMEKMNQGKAKSFYDLLMMSRLGVCKLNKKQDFGRYSSISIELK